MRKLTITRKKHFAGSLIPYYCATNMTKDQYINYLNNSRYNEEQDNQNIEDNIHRIKNGQTINIEIDENQNNLFIIAPTSTGKAYSNEITIDEGNQDLTYNLKTKYNIIKGLRYELEKEV